MGDQSRYTPGTAIVGCGDEASQWAIKEVTNAYKRIVTFESDVQRAGGSREVAARMAAAREMLDEAAGFLQTGERGRHFKF